jgi:hypothetical protein
MYGCVCDTLPEAFYLDQAPEGWLTGFHEVASTGWRTLQCCASCGRMFSVDVYDKYQERVVIRVFDSARWEEADSDHHLQKQLLLQSCGGIEGGECIRMGCSNPRVRGVYYCLDHLWDVGARR